MPLTRIKQVKVPLTRIKQAEVPLTRINRAEVPLTRIKQAEVPLTRIKRAEVPLGLNGLNRLKCLYPGVKQNKVLTQMTRSVLCPFESEAKWGKIYFGFCV